jgi:hypothetical protein
MTETFYLKFFPAHTSTTVISIRHAWKNRLRVRLTVGPSETVDLQSPVQRLLEELEIVLVLQVQLGGLVRLVVGSDWEGGPQVLILDLVLSPRTPTEPKRYFLYYQNKALSALTVT